MSSQRSKIGWSITAAIALIVIIGAGVYLFEMSNEVRRLRTMEARTRTEYGTDTEAVALADVEVRNAEPKSRQIRKVFDVAPGSAGDVARSLRELFGEQIRVAAIEASHSVVVTATTDTLDEINQFLEELAVHEKKRIAVAQTYPTDMEPAYERGAVRPSGSDELDDEPARSYGLPDDEPPLNETMDRHVDEQALSEDVAFSEPEIEPSDDLSSVAAFPVTSDSPAAAKPVPVVQHSTGTPSRPEVFADDAIDEELEQQARQLAQRIRTAPVGAQSRMMNELRAITNQQFEHRQQRRRQEFEELTSRIERLNERMVQRQQNRTAIIERRISDLLNPQSDLDWEAAGQPRTTISPRVSEPGVDEPVVRREPTSTGEEQLRFHTDQADSTSSQPTFNGVTLQKWLHLLQTERNEMKVAEGMMGLLHLWDQGDARKIVQTVLQIIRAREDLISHGTSGMGGQNNSAVVILNGSVLLLMQLPHDLVLEELFKEIANPAAGKPSREFLAYFLQSVENSMVATVIWSPTSSLGSAVTVQVPYERAITLSRQLQHEFRNQSRRWVKLFVEIAARDESLTDWSMRSAGKVVHFSQQWITTYPELVPLVEKRFDQLANQPSIPMIMNASIGFYRGPVAASLLGECGLRVSEIEVAAKSRLKQLCQFPPLQNPPELGSIGPNDIGSIDASLVCLAAIAPHSPTAVTLLIETLESQYEELIKNSIQPGDDETTAFIPDRIQRADLNFRMCQSLIEALARVGVLARPALNLLKRIQEQEQIPTGTVNGSLKDDTARAIERIEQATPKTKPEPLPDDSSGRVETGIQPNAALSRGTSSGPLLEELPKDETTYDGITYSQWLRLLETERKPDKLIDAIQVCTRLAKKADERQIARAVFRVQSFFETDELHQEAAWKAGQIGLERFPADIVIDELIKSLRAAPDSKAACQFQYQFLIEFGSSSGEAKISRIAALQLRSTEIVEELLRLNPDPATVNTLPPLAAASVVCELSKRSIEEFDGLKDCMAQALNQEFEVTQARFNNWLIIARFLTTQAPQSPGLAVTLANFCDKNSAISQPVMELIGELGPLAEPAVPILVQFVVRELRDVEAAMFPQAPRLGGRPDARKAQLIYELLARTVESLGKVGVGQSGYDLIYELRRVHVPPRPIPAEMSRFPGLFGSETFIDPFKRIIDAANVAFERFQGMQYSGTQVLGDDLRMWGNWRTQEPELNPTSPPQQQLRLRIRRSTLYLERLSRDSGGSGEGYLEMFGTQPLRITLQTAEHDRPKRLKLEKMPGRNSDESPESVEGIYELTETTLKLQLSPAGQPAPIEFATSQEELPPGQIRIELERYTPEPNTGTP